MDFRDQTLAKYFLLGRRHSYSFRYMIWLSRYRIVPSLILLGALLVVCGFVLDSGLWSTSIFVIGYLSGGLMRDLGWFRSVHRQWPFTERVIDWPRVEAYAAGEIQSERQD